MVRERYFCLQSLATVGLKPARFKHLTEFEQTENRQVKRINFFRIIGEPTFTTA